MSPDQAREIRYDPARRREVFMVDVHDPGILHLELVPRSLDPLGTRIEGLRDDCSEPGSEALSFVDRSPGLIVAKVREPGRYFFSVRTSPLMPEGTCHLYTGLSRSVDLHLARGPLPSHFEGAGRGVPKTGRVEEGWSDGGDDGAGDLLLPIWIPAKLATSQSGRVEEGWSDGGDDGSGHKRPWGGPEGSAGRLRLREPAILELASLDLPGSETLLALAAGDHAVTASAAGAPPRLYRPCARPGGDDHGDTFTCATEIRLGARVVGRIDDVPSSDQDLFSFRLDRPETVVLETAGAAGTQGRIWDAHGRLVATSQNDGEAASFRLVEDLAPGRYFLGIEGEGVATSGPYTLEVRALPLVAGITP